MSDKITPRKLQGFWELEPSKQIIFDNMLEKIKKAFKKHCFLPLDTPAMELSEILLAKSGGEIDKEIYRFVKGSTDACLRYDLTVPLARFVAMNENTLNFPFKRYQIGKVYRGERPQKGRMREFYQCDADIIGDGKLSLVNDAECIKLYDDIFKELNLDVEVEISSRKILFGIINSLKLSEKFNEIAIILDKFDKIGEKEVKNQLSELGASESACSKLVEFVSICGGSEKLENAASLCADESYQEGIRELKEIAGYLDKMDMTNYKFNFGIIRGHNYYTGAVFEVYIAGRRSLGAVGAGGRYDELASYFTDRHLPGVGMSVGISRLFDLLDRENNFEGSESPTQVAIIPLGETLGECLKACTYLRDNNISADVLSEDKSFKSKMKDAGRRQIPFVAIIGEDELKNGVLMLKNMKLSTQSALKYDEVVKVVKENVNHN